MKTSVYFKSLTFLVTRPKAEFVNLKSLFSFQRVNVFDKYKNLYGRCGTFSFIVTSFPPSIL